ncbi:kinesin-4, partial [Trifolium medium]|nr:kinesin-4 [Trifolium medium]
MTAGVPNLSSRNLDPLKSLTARIHVAMKFPECVQPVIAENPNSFSSLLPDATMLPCKSTADVIKLMDIGLKNRAKSSTAMNERSSRSH